MPRFNIINIQYINIYLSHRYWQNLIADSIDYFDFGKLNPAGIAAQMLEIDAHRPEGR